MSKSNLVLSDGYQELLEGLKDRIRSSQIRAAIAVNQELILLYWQIGQEILIRQEQQGWGAKVITQLSKDLAQEFPEMRGFSTRNLKYMRTFANAYPDLEIGQQAVAQIPWGHNCVLLDKVQEPSERLWYARKCLEHGWSRAVLTAQIESGLYLQKRGTATTNFDRTLPQSQSDLAHAIIKDPYHLDFLLVDENIRHQDLKRALMAHIRDFLVELGVGFAFAGKDYRLEIGGEEFVLDLLFYHLELRCFVIIELKMDEFKPDYSGRMNLFISAIDDQVRKPGDQPTIGLILCKSKNKTVAEYATRNLRNPIAVAEHKLPKLLPTTEQLELELENAAQQLEASEEAEA
ncbi:MAG: PDDEXK nuclease domain-containing protein [Cyanobacteria bacterium P01_C01_bin.120]